MKKTTRLFSTVILVAIVLAACLALVACDGGTVNNYFVTYDGNKLTVSGKKGEAVSFPEATRDGYLFDGWYTSEDYSGSAVESAIFGEETTYYAKWAEACTITLQPEGGSVKGTSLTVKEGANLLEALADYTPTKGDLQFGGWFEGDNQITSSTVATKGSLTLTARYKAAYTVTALVEKEDGSGYDTINDYANGYAFVGEDFFPEVTMEGFTISDDDKNDKIIDEDSSKNVFTIHFQRATYKVSVYESYPQSGIATRLSTKEYKYGAKDFLPTDTFKCEGYLMLGWATKRAGTYNDIVGSDYVLNSDIELYPLWEQGYTDMFSGEDYIFLKHDAEDTAIILRGGVDGIQIEGKLNTRYGLYEFKNPEDKTVVRAKIEGEHFIYYATRAASYTLLNGLTGLDEKITLSLDQMNGVTYYDRENNKTFKGTYTIDETGIYIADLTETTDGGETKNFAFIIGTYNNTNAFRIRGEEFNYGEMARRAAYYPTMTFDGFGTVTVNTSSQSATYTYAADSKGIITVVAGQEDLTLKIKQYSGAYGYDFYDENLDRGYSFEQGSSTTLTLDGCATAVFQSADETFTGTYSSVQSVLYDVINNSAVSRTIVTVYNETLKETRTYVLYMDYLKDQEGKPIGIPVHWFKEVGNDYTEGRLVTDDGMVTDSYLIIEGDGKASTYEYIEKVLTKTSEGSYELDSDGYSYTYVPSDSTNAVEFKYASMTLAFSDYNGLSLCFALSTTDSEGHITNKFERFRTKGAGESAELIKASVFGIYINADGDVFCGLLREVTNYFVLTDTQTNYYLSFDETDDSRFYVLENAPLVMYKRVDGKTDRTSTLTITWKEIESGKFEASYATTDSKTEETTTVNGYYTSNLLQYPGLSAYLYTFTANDGSVQFKFYLSSSGSSYYFNYFEESTVIEFGSYTQLKDDDSTDENTKLIVTDELVDGKLVLVFSDGETQVKGNFDTYQTTIDGEKVTVVGKETIAFGNEEYKAVVYTFTSLDGNTMFKFTLNNNYFRVCAENASYTDNNGAKLDLDGATHMARYTDAQGKTSYSYYVVSEGVLEENGKAIYMLVNEVGTYLDLLGDNFNIRGTESGDYNVFKNGVPYGKTIHFDGQGKATVTDNGTENVTKATYTINDDLLTVYVNGEVLYVGKISTVTLGGRSYPAYSLVMDSIAGSYINNEDLSVIVLDNVGNAVRYNSYGVADQGYYFRIDDNLFYFINSASSFAGLYTFNGNEIVNTGDNMTFYSSDFASVVFYATGSVLINNSESMYYVLDANGNAKTYKAAANIDDEGTNGYGYVVGSIEINDGKIEYTLNDVTRTYTLSDNTHITLTDSTHGYTLEFQPNGDPTFTVLGTLTAAPAEGESEGKTTQYYVGVDYDDDGNPYVFLADAVSDYVNKGALKYNFTRNYEIDVNYDDKTFSFVQDNFTMGMIAYNYMYVYYLSYFGSNYASMLSSMNGILSFVCDTNGAETTYTLSGAFNYIKAADGTAFTFTDATLSEAGYYTARFGHAYVAEFVVDGETYHLTFFLMPPETATGTYVYRIYSLTKVTNKVVIDAANNTEVYEETLVYTEFNIADGGKDSDGNDTYYKVDESFLPLLKYNGKLVGNYPCEKSDDNTWIFFGATFDGGKLDDEIRYIFTATYDEDTGAINGGTVEKQILLQAVTANGDTIYAWYDGNKTVVEVVGILYKGDETITSVENDVKAESGEVFTFTLKGVSYKVEFTFTTDESGAQQVTVTLTEQTQETEQAA